MDDPRENPSSPLPLVLITDKDHKHFDRVGRLTSLTALEADGQKSIILLPDGYHTLAGTKQFIPYTGNQAA
jgi:hypothetical protein